MKLKQRSRSRACQSRVAQVRSDKRPDHYDSEISTFSWRPTSKLQVMNVCQYENSRLKSWVKPLTETLLRYEWSILDGPYLNLSYWCLYLFEGPASTPLPHQNLKDRGGTLRSLYSKNPPTEHFAVIFTDIDIENLTVLSEFFLINWFS